MSIAARPLQEEALKTERAEAAAVAAAPLSAEHFAQLEQAKQRSRKIRRAAGVAAFSGWTTAAFGAIALPFGLFGLTTLVLSAALLVIGTNELRLRKMLLRLDPRATSRLALNQIAFIAVLATYAAWSMYQGLNAQSELSAAIGSGPGMETTAQWVEDTQRLVVIGIYGALIAGTLVFQGSAALYYFTRAGHLQRYIRETPDWIKDLQRRGQQL